MNCQLISVFEAEAGGCAFSSKSGCRHVKMMLRQEPVNLKVVSLSMTEALVLSHGLYS